MERSQENYRARNGLVYSQETSSPEGPSRQPSQMKVFWDFGLQPPGGKLIHPTLVLFGQSGTLLVSNDPQGPPRKILECERFGARTKLQPTVCSIFTKVFQAFDLIVLDAPCSGVRDVSNLMPWTIGPSIILESVVSFKERF